jgi:hypothetical protein
VVTPAHTAGTVGVYVVTNHGTSVGWRAKRYTYVAPPTVTHVDPATGPAAGGTVGTIRGSGFRSGTRVLFGTTPGTSVRVVSATTLTVTAPKHAAGAVRLSVTTAYGSAAGTYTFSP